MCVSPFVSLAASLPLSPQLLLMKRGGEAIYMGPLGTNSQIMIDYFQVLPQCHPGITVIPSG